MSLLPPRRSALWALSLCWLLGTGCGVRTSSSNTAGGKVGWITLGTKEKPRTLDPSDAYELSSLGVITNMGERLYTYNPGSTQLVPQLATALPQVSADGLTYTIPIRQGVVFHDGTPFDAEAMAFSLRRFIVNGGGPSFLLSDRIDYLRPPADPKSKQPPQVNPDGIKATGKYELTIKLKQPFAAFSSLLAFPGACAISPQAYAAHVATIKATDDQKEDKNKYKTDGFVGTGPYKMRPQTSEDRIELEAFDRYWGQKPQNQGVTIQIYLGSSANLYNSFKTGAVDVAYLSLEPDQVRSLKEGQASRGWKVTEVDGNGTMYMMLNVRQKPLDNRLVRQAIAAMLDRPLLNQRVLYGQAKPLYSIVPSSFSESQPGFKAAYSNAQGGADLAKAKALLQQAGYSAGQPAKVQIWYRSSRSEHKMVANFLRAYAQKYLDGLLVFEPIAAERTAFTKMLKSGAYPVAFQDWYPDFVDVDTYIQPFLECPKPKAGGGCDSGGSAEQGSFYHDATMNKLIADQGRAQDAASRRPLLTAIQEQVVRDVPQIPLWQSKDFIFSRPGVSGVGTDPLQNLRYADIVKANKASLVKSSAP
jgi:peptide/nickel transport system substrate-binding protein